MFSSYVSPGKRVLSARSGSGFFNVDGDRDPDSAFHVKTLIIDGNGRWVTKKGDGWLN
jgi:hypothetical protein